MPRGVSYKRILKILGLTAAVGFGCLASLVAVACFVWIKIYIPHCRQKAEARWAAIGRSMSEFDKRLKPVPENDSLRALTHELQPFGIRSLYKARLGEQNPNSINVPTQITDVVDPSKSPRADQVDLTGHDFSYLDQHAADLNQLYKGVLRREPAVWNLVPQDGMTLRVPSYLAARHMSQLIWVDALRKLDSGNEKGAAEAVAAGLKMTSNIGEQPILVSQMIRVAIDRLYDQVIVRLPEDPEALKHLAAEVDAKREMWRNAIQTETWAVMRVVDYAGMKPDDFKTFYQSKSFLQRIRISSTKSLMEGDCSLFILDIADQLATSEQVSNLVQSDLGIKRMNEASSRYAPILTTGPRFGSFSEAFRPNFARSWLRLNATLLLHEQAELIRSARAKVQLGKSGNLGEINSVVIAGAKWHISGDAIANSVSLKLTPIPSWTNNRDAIDENFFLLPLDGSKSWKFRPRLVASHTAGFHSR